MHAKVSHNGLRFFAHNRDAPNCALALETPEHLKLKRDLARAAQVVGADAEMEVNGTDRAWRADVLASDPRGKRKMALEAQLAHITEHDIIDRTRQMHADIHALTEPMFSDKDFTSIWFNDRSRRPSWFGAVPSVCVTRPCDGHY